MADLEEMFEDETGKIKVGGESVTDKKVPEQPSGGGGDEPGEPPGGGGDEPGDEPPPGGGGDEPPPGGGEGEEYAVILKNLKEDIGEKGDIAKFVGVTAGGKFHLKVYNNKENEYFSVFTSDRYAFCLKDDKVEYLEKEWNVNDISLNQFKVFLFNESGYGDKVYPEEIEKLIEPRKEEEDDNGDEEDVIPVCTWTATPKFGWFVDDKEDNDITSSYEIKWIVDEKDVVLEFPRAFYCREGDEIEFQYVENKLLGIVKNIMWEDNELIITQKNSKGESQDLIIRPSQIIRLSKIQPEQEKKDDEEEEQENIVCKSVTLIENLSNPYLGKVLYTSFIKNCVFGTASFKKGRDSYDALMNLCDSKAGDDNDTNYYFQNIYDIKSAQELDDKVLKYIVLSIKNNPQYFQPDGFLYFYYDTNYDQFDYLLNMGDKVWMSVTTVVEDFLAVCGDNEFLLYDKSVSRLVRFSVDKENRKIVLPDNDILTMEDFTYSIHSFTREKYDGETTDNNMLLLTMLNFVNLIAKN